MVLLRLLADILLYLALGLVAYWFFTEEITALWIAIGFGIISILLFVFTTDVRRSSRRQSTSAWDIWDWFYFIDVLEIPFQVLGWLLKRLWRIFD